MRGYRGTPAERFWRKVAKGEPDACWNWQAATYHDGYGSFRLGNRNVASHRAAWELTFGVVPDGLWVLHRCDVRACCNPAHLFLGTPSDNAKDMVSKGRHSVNGRKGELHHGAKLSIADVRAIRNGYVMGEPINSLAARFNVTPQNIRRITARQTWATV